MSTYPENRNRIVSGFNPYPDAACRHLSGRAGGVVTESPIGGTRAASCSALRYAERSRVGG